MVGLIIQMVAIYQVKKKKYSDETELWYAIWSQKMCGICPSWQKLNEPAVDMPCDTMQPQGRK